MVATANTNAWGSAKKRLIETAATVAFIQEHKFTYDDQIDEASPWCAKEGWAAAWGKASFARPSWVYFRLSGPPVACRTACQTPLSAMGARRPSRVALAAPRGGSDVC